MTDKKEYIRTSLENGLYYSRILMEHSTILLILLGRENLKYTSIFNEEQNKYIDINNLFLDISDGKVSYSFIESRKLVTPNTLELEYETSRLFNVKIDFNLTLKSLKLKCGDFSLNSVLLDKVNDLNRKLTTYMKVTLSIIELLKEANILKDRFLIEHFIMETELFINNTERLIENVGLDPTYVYSTLYYYSDFMMQHSLIYTKSVGEDNELLKKGANLLLTSSTNLMKDFNNEISPTSINNISKSCDVRVREFETYNYILNNKLINDSLVFSFPPILSDHILRETYDFLSILELLDKS